MQSLGLSENDSLSKPPGFLERQFSTVPTAKQSRFDWTFGVVLPIICIAADPIVFRSIIPEDEGLLQEYKTFAYVLSSVSIMTMAAWLLWGARLSLFRSYIAGLFIVASAISLLVGIVLLPLSLIGSILLIGLLGFTPLFSAFVFFRNAFRMLDEATDVYPRVDVWRAATLGALYSFVTPLVLHYSF